MWVHKFRDEEVLITYTFLRFRSLDAASTPRWFVSLLLVFASSWLIEFLAKSRGNKS